MKIIPALVLAAIAAPALAEAPGFRADFRRDPASLGFGLQGADDGRFAWQRGEGLVVALDSNAPGSRLVAPLGMTLDGSTSFRVEADIVLSDVDASPDDFFQLAFGLVNQGSTGLNRTGTSLAGPPFFVDDSDTFDSVEFAYYPNVTFFGGPFLQPTVFGAERGSAFANFAANFGPSADLGDNGPGEITELPQGVPLRIVLEHDACRQALTTRILDVGGPDPVELATGLQPLDLSFLNATGTFTVDAFAIHAYQDLADWDPSTRSLAASLEVLGARVAALPHPTARMAPRSVNDRVDAPARIHVRDALADAAVIVVEAGGSPVHVPLSARPWSDGVVAEIPRALATLDLVLDVGGCLVPVDAARQAPR